MAKGIFNKIREVFYTREAKPLAQVSSVSTTIRMLYGEVPQVLFIKLFEYYYKDPIIQGGVNAYRDRIMGDGFYVTSKNEEITKALKEFNDGIDIYELVYDSLGDLLTTGNILWELISPSKVTSVSRVNLSTITGLKRDELTGNALEYYQEIANSPKKTLPAKHFIHHKLFEVARDPWGIGIFHSLAIPYYEMDGKEYSLLDDVAQIRQDIARTFHTYANPKDIYTYEGANTQFLEEEKLKHKNAKAGESIFTNRKFIHEEIAIDPRAKFVEYLNFIEAYVDTGVQVPTQKSVMQSTYASAGTARDMFTDRTDGIKRAFGSFVVKNLYNEVLKAKGFDPDVIIKAEVELIWGNQLQKRSLDEVAKAANVNIQGKPLILWEEARKMIKTDGWDIDLSVEPENINIPQPIDNPFDKGQVDKPQINKSQIDKDNEEEDNEDKSTSKVKKK